MVNRSTATLAGAALTLALVLALLIGGGLTVRRLISQAFEVTTRSRDVLGVSRQSLVAQLDEETGIRGFAATGNRAFLEPFDRAAGKLPSLLDQLSSGLDVLGLVDARAAAADARAANTEWLRTVALGALQDPSPRSRITLAGKAIVDRFRADVDRINSAVGARQLAGQESVRRSIDRINVFVAVASVIVALIGGTFLEVQRRANERTERERLRAESEAREAQSLRAAYAAEKRIADSLQEAIAQRPLPLLPSLRFSATYVPATEETKVGGDWYDALELPQDRVLFAIGDVTGHGIEAAVTMNRARQALISSALVSDDPSAVLGRVNEELFRQSAPLVTAVAGFADAGTYEFVYSTAGHPPPLLIEPGRRPRLLDCGSLPLGALTGTRYQVHRIQSVPGATLVLYTDGAVEHSRDVIEGEELLIAAAAEAADQASEDTASYIHQKIFAGRSVGDDVAILTISFADDAARGLRITAEGAQSAFTGRLARATPATVTSLMPQSRRRPLRPARIAS